MLEGSRVLNCCSVIARGVGVSVIRIGCTASAAASVSRAKLPKVRSNIAE